MPFTAANGSVLACNYKAINPSIIAGAAEASPELQLRRSANYQPNQWDYNSIKWLDHGDSDQVKKRTAVEIEKLKEEVRCLIKQENMLVARLELIDDVLHLGLGHHFGEEIKHVLTSISIKNAVSAMKEDLYAMALFFRLLRQHGLHVSQDVFSHFKDEEGCFRVSLEKDVKGMLSLYEASFLGFDGEETLEEARNFTTKHLGDLIPCMHPYLKVKVERSLELPLHWRTPRLEARWWWKKLGLGERTSFARDRLIECYFCAAGVVFDPEYGFCREELTKVMTLITTLDDVYDVYGSLDELRLFTKAIDRWECNGCDELPEYMKICYNSLYNTADELANKILILEGWDAMPYIRNVWTDLCKAFLVEAEWYYNGYKPSLQEYLNNGWMSASGHVIMVHVFLLSQQTKTEEALKHLMNYPNLIRSSSLIFRLCNDLATSAAELDRGDHPTSIKCFMNEYNITENEARKEIGNLINRSWKELNEGLANCIPLSTFFGNTAVNLSRLIHFVYQHGDSYGAPDQEKQNQIKSLFFEPIKLEENLSFYRIN
ncbi:hypothetical protein J5N97_027222 [Dioscorea zingiberensis]|uniref:Uncharacterized protein n=1 Tax=Dioscorea zingiberensis TaxID=325984 RepID=A0A9D5C4F3_9LILI|nr:hypothetical protein J5N97_027222 [Dioscorea zingiberensis]